MRVPTPGTLGLHTIGQEEKKEMGIRENCRSHIRRKIPRNIWDIRIFELPETTRVAENKPDWNRGSNF